MFNDDSEDKDLGFGGDFSDDDDAGLDLGDDADLDLGLEDPEDGDGFGDNKDEY